MRTAIVLVPTILLLIQTKQSKQSKPNNQHALSCASYLLSLAGKVRETTIERFFFYHHYLHPSSVPSQQRHTFFRSLDFCVVAWRARRLRAGSQQRRQLLEVAVEERVDRHQGRAKCIVADTNGHFVVAAAYRSLHYTKSTRKISSCHLLERSLARPTYRAAQQRTHVGDVVGEEDVEARQWCVAELLLARQEVQDARHELQVSRDLARRLC